MNTRILIGLALLGLAASPLNAQQRGVRAGGPGGPGMQDPVTYLLERGEALELTADQTTALEAARDSLVTVNRPLMEDMRALRGSGDRSRMRPLMQTMMTNNEAWLEKALALLQPAQRETARKLLAERPRGGRRGGGPGGT